MIIAGAGLAGLLAGNMLSLAHRPRIYEAQSALPNNHSALLRFRTGAVGDVVGIPFRKVTCIKAVLPWRNPVADALSYSFKNSGVRRSDRSVIRSNEVVERFIAPSDLIQRLAARLPDINYGRSAFTVEATGKSIISTIPMPALMDLLGYPHHKRPAFTALSGKNIKARIKDCDAYISLAVPDPVYPFTRISITGDELIVECPGAAEVSLETVARDVFKLLGPFDAEGWEVRDQKYFKIIPIDESVRREFIHWATKERNVFSLGRFATWRPGLLLDDLIHDIRLIEKWTTTNDSYAVARAK